MNLLQICSPFSLITFFFLCTVLTHSKEPEITQIHFQGLKVTHPSVVKRELHHKVGDSFSHEHWKIEQKRLEALDIFASVELKVDTLIQENQKTIHTLTYLFQELPHFVSFAGGKKTDRDGFLLGPAFLALNFLGRDIRLEGFFRTTVPDVFQTNEWLFSSHALWLGPLPIEHSFSYTYTDANNLLLNYHERSHHARLNLFQRLTPSFHLLYKGEISRVHADSANRQRILLSKTSRDWVPKLGFGFRIDTRESRVNPHRGHYLETSYTHNGGFLGGPAEFTELLWDNRSFFSLGAKHILNWNNLIQHRYGTVGAYDRFYLGGANTLRGYHFGDSLSGNSEWIMNLEYRYEWISRKTIHVFKWPIFVGLQWVAGTDFGMVWNASPFSDFSKDNVGSSYYTGFHILVPALDRIRIEVGSQITRVRLEWTLGLFEKSTVQRWRVR